MGLLRIVINSYSSLSACIGGRCELKFVPGGVLRNDVDAGCGRFVLVPAKCVPLVLKDSSDGNKSIQPFLQIFQQGIGDGSPVSRIR